MKKLKWTKVGVNEMKSGQYWILKRSKGKTKFKRPFELNHKYSYWGSFKKLSSAKKVAQLIHNG